MRKRWVSVALWSAAAVVVVGIGSAAVGAASSTGSNVLSADDIQRQLESSTPTPTSPPDSPGSSPSGLSQLVNTSAGSVIAACTQEKIQILRWAPLSQYRTDDKVAPAPAPSATVNFESDTKDDVKVIVYCDLGTVKYRTEIGSDDHGGQRPTISPTPGPSAPSTGDDHGGHGADDGTGHQ